MSVNRAGTPELILIAPFPHLKWGSKWFQTSFYGGFPLIGFPWSSPQKIRQISEMSKPRRKHWCHSTNHPQQPGTFHQATMVCELPKKSFHICRRRHGHDSGKNFRKFRRKIPFKSVPIASPLAGKKKNTCWQKSWRKKRSLCYLRDLVVDAKSLRCSSFCCWMKKETLPWKHCLGLWISSLVSKVVKWKLSACQEEETGLALFPSRCLSQSVWLL